MQCLGEITTAISIWSPSYRYAIDVATGESEKVPGVAPQVSLEQLGKLKLALMNTGNRKSEKEEQSFLDFFNASGYSAAEVDGTGKKSYSDRWLPRHLTDAVIRRWRTHRELTIDLALKLGEKRDWEDLWELPFLEKYSDVLLERCLSIADGSTMGSLKVKPQDGAYLAKLQIDLKDSTEPIDLIWATIQIDALSGITYRKCESESCPQYFPMSFRNDGRRFSRKYCGHLCGDREWKRVQKKKDDRKWVRVVVQMKKKWDRLPPAKQKGMVCSTYIAEQARKIKPEFPYAANFVTSTLKRNKA